MSPTVWTLGHSNHDLATFQRLVAGAGLERVVDVRRFPSSKRHPWFNKPSLADALGDIGVGYMHLVDLGAHRDGAPDSPNTGLDGAFRAYADHMATPAFLASAQHLAELAAAERVGVLCAEASWEHCHRRFLADRLTTDGVDVLHLAADGSETPHVSSELAEVVGGRLVYRGVTQLGFGDWNS